MKRRATRRRERSSLGPTDIPQQKRRKLNHGGLKRIYKNGKPQRENGGRQPVSLL